MDTFEVQMRIGKQEDGLWRVEVPDLQGCFVDAPTLAEALSDIHEVAAMILDLYIENGWSLPGSAIPANGEPLNASFPVVVSEHRMTRPRRTRR